MLVALVGACASTSVSAGTRSLVEATRTRLDAQYAKGNGEAPTTTWSGSATQYAHLGVQAFATYALAKTLHLDQAWQYPVAVGTGWLGWQIADLTAGTIHMLFDGYGSSTTPVLGSLLRIFKDHHRDALAQTRAAIPYLVAPFTFLTAPILLYGADLQAGAWAPKAMMLGFGVGLSVAGVSHKYSHLRDRVGVGIEALRAGGLFMKPTEHDRHHRFPNSKAFGQLSGRTNGLAERVRYYERLQALIYKTTGAVHDSWRHPRGGHEAMVAALGPDPAKHPRLSRADSAK